MDKFVNSIKKKYRGRLTYKEKQWPPRHSKELIQLELVEKEEKVGLEHQLLGEREDKDIKTKRTPLAYCDVFKVESGKEPVRKVLVEGGAGIGKTTLCISISEDWANGKLFQQFKLLLLLPLRHPKVSSAGSLSELLKLLHTSKDVYKSVVSYLEEEEGENVLIIADGWDELSESERQEGSFLYELLFRELPFASVLVTSRPSASNPLYICIERSIDILGFDKENIEEFIQAEFAHDQQKAISLSKQLEGNPLVESVCSVPLNCAIVCHLWRTLGEALPTTMTELYRKIILNFILRNIRKADTDHDIKILTDFDSLPSDLQQSWWRLCEFAFQALIRNQIVFSQEDLSELFPQESPIDEKLLFFGLLQPAESILETGYGVSYHFLHLTFQEYLAALHLVKHPLDQQSTIFKSLGSDSDSTAVFYAISDNFIMVWRFYFGIYFHESKKRGKNPNIQQVRQHISGIKTFIDDDQLLWHCAFEAKSAEVISEILLINYDQIEDDSDLEMCDSDLFLADYIDFGEPSNAHDCAAILHAISNIQECSKMEISFCKCGVRENQIKSLGDTLANKEGKVQIKKLYLSGNKLTDIGICNLFQRSSPAFRSLEELDLGDNKIGAESIKSITTALKELPFNTLSVLNLSNNPLGVPGMKALDDAVCCDVLVNLRQLNLTGSLTSVNSEVVASLIEAVSVHCPKLQRIIFSSNTSDVSGVQAHIIIIFTSGKYSKELNLSISGLSDRYVSELFLRTSTAFQSLIKHLDLSNNRIGVETIKAMSLVLQWTPSNILKYLNLSNNPLGVSGLQALEDAVCDGSLRTLEHLNLQSCLTSDADINGALLTTFVEGLSAHCPYFALLDLSQNNLCTPGASALARKSMKQLIKLNLNETMLGDSGLRALVDNSKASCHAHTLILSGNNIHGGSISCLLANVEQWKEIDLSDNPLGIDGVLSIGRLISSSQCHLARLKLSKCQLTSSEGDLSSYSEVVRDLGQQLCQMFPSSTITQLNLARNNFSEERIHILAEFMYLCPSLENLNSRHCQINSCDLKQLLEQLSELQTLSPGTCSKLAYWNLRNNKIDDNGVSVLIDHHLTTLPSMGSQFMSSIESYIDVTDNAVSSEMLKRLQKEPRRRHNVMVRCKCGFIQQMHENIYNIIRCTLGRE